MIRRKSGSSTSGAYIIRFIVTWIIRVRGLLTVRTRNADWRSLIQRLTAVGAGALFVLIDPAGALYQAPRLTGASAREEIPLGARIIRVADTFDALISDRPYRRGKTLSQAVEELRQIAGTVLDREVVETFLRVLAVKPPFDIQLRMWRERS